MTVTIADIQQYLRLPPVLDAAEQKMIEGLIAAAEEELIARTDKTYEEAAVVGLGNSYKLAIMLKVASDYDFRGIITDKQVYMLGDTYNNLLALIGVKVADE